jgi:hypothetical protein
MAYTGMIKWVRNGRRVFTPVGAVTSLAALETYANALQAYANARPRKISATTVKYFDLVAEPGAGKWDGYILVVQLKRDPPPSNDTPYRQARIVSPKDEIVEVVGETWRIKKAIGDQIATDYSLATGHTYKRHDSWLWN